LRNDIEDLQDHLAEESAKKVKLEKTIATISATTTPTTTNVDSNTIAELNSIKQTFTTLQTLFESTSSMLKDANAKLLSFTSKQT